MRLHEVNQFNSFLPIGLSCICGASTKGGSVVPSPQTLVPSPDSMTDFEQSMVSLGISAATAFSLPKSVGAFQAGSGPRIG
jgi:hypothetical protein